MAKKKINSDNEEVLEKKIGAKDDDESILGDDLGIDAAIIEDTFTEDFSEYNDVDNF